MSTNPNFPKLIQGYFLDRLMHQQQASAHTIASHRDTFRLLIAYAKAQLNLSPSKLNVHDLDAPFIIDFLTHLEKDRRNSSRSRNTRLSAIRSFFRYVALNEPSVSHLAQRVLAIPNKRYERTQVNFLTQEEAIALLSAPDQDTRTGRRDRVLLLIALQTGLRVSELISLRWESIVFGSGAHIKCIGKGRKERCTPLRKDAVTALQTWAHECPSESAEPVFPSSRGGHLSRDGVEYLVTKYATMASHRCKSLKKKSISPHVLRHTTAMELLQHGIDRSVIALWLGHESVNTTDVYLHADLKMKERALAKTSSHNLKYKRYKPDDQVLAFLNAL
ncbi:tyrosine-type recombinase/integrase [Planctomycetota bacterium]